MSDMNRTIAELLDDYAGALRDGCIPVFLKSLTRHEARLIASSRDFRDAADLVRSINGAGFADKAVAPNVNLFISRVNAKIASRSKKARAPSRQKGHIRTRTRKTEKPI